MTRAAVEAYLHQPGSCLEFAPKQAIVRLQRLQTLLESSPKFKKAKMSEVALTSAIIQWLVPGGDGRACAHHFGQGTGKQNAPLVRWEKEERERVAAEAVTKAKKEEKKKRDAGEAEEEDEQ